MGACGACLQSERTHRQEKKRTMCHLESVLECAISLIIVQYVVQRSASSVYVQLDSEEK